MTRSRSAAVARACAVPCPYCAAAPNRPCTSSSRARLSVPHAARFRAADEADAEPDPGDEYRALTDRLADLLRRTADALNGPPPPLTAWSWHDLPEKAAAWRAGIDTTPRDPATASTPGQMWAALLAMPEGERLEALRAKVDDCDGIVRPGKVQCNPYARNVRKPCPDCHHFHTPTGCVGPTAADLWAGVSPDACDCPRQDTA